MAVLKLLTPLLFAALCSTTAFENPGSVATKPDNSVIVYPADTFAGAWRLVDKSAVGPTHDAPTVMKIHSDNYFMVAYYHQERREFISARGGTYAISNGQYRETAEFNSLDSTQVGTSGSFKYQLRDQHLTLTDAKTGKQETWLRLEPPLAADAPLAGNWRISQRQREGQLVAIPQGPRKTIKILSASHFQWAAFNTATGQFFGTGGGTYTAKQGKYEESVAFFSRDASRVGLTLSFDFRVKDNDWQHSGKSSTGIPIKEVWSKKLSENSYLSLLSIKGNRDI